LLKLKNGLKKLVNCSALIKFSSQLIFFIEWLQWKKSDALNGKNNRAAKKRWPTKMPKIILGKYVEKWNISLTQKCRN
jgi:hypothetical protein